jgi:glycosyltransferase involved in cell wall biosynthesis
VPAVSIVIPIFNTESYIERCLRSVLAQSFRDTEIICVDDASSDGSASIVKAIAAKDSRIRLLSYEKHLGPGGARNYGIRTASSDLIMSVDSDDYVDGDFVGSAYAAAISSRAEIVAFGLKTVTETGEVVGNLEFEPRRFTAPFANPFGMTNPSFCSKIWRRSLFTENDIWFPDHIYYEDLATIPRLVARASSLQRIAGSPYRYVVRKGSITRTNSQKHADDMAEALSILRDFFVADQVFPSVEKVWLARVMQAICSQEKLAFMGPSSFGEKLRYSRALRTTVLGRLGLGAKEGRKANIDRGFYALRLHLSQLAGAKA